MKNIAFIICLSLITLVHFTSEAGLILADEPNQMLELLLKKTLEQQRIVKIIDKMEAIQSESSILILDSIISSSSEDIPLYKTEYTYDPSGETLSKIHYDWDQKASKWIFRHKYEWEHSNDYYSESIFNWDPISQKWVGQEKTINSNDGYYDEIKDKIYAPAWEIKYTWNPNEDNWEYFSKWVNQYDKNQNLVETVAYMWDTTKSCFYRWSEYKYEYRSNELAHYIHLEYDCDGNKTRGEDRAQEWDNSGNLRSETYLKYDPLIGWWKMSSHDYIYSNNTLTTSYLYTYSLTTSGIIIPGWKSCYEYENNLLIRETDYYYSDYSNEYEFNSIIEYSYNDQGNMTEKKGNSTYQTPYKYEYYYDELNNETQCYYSYDSGGDNWTRSLYYEKEYDAYGNLSTLTQYMLGFFFLTSKEVWEYDAKGRLLLNEKYNWVNSSLDLECEYREEKRYDEYDRLTFDLYWTSYYHLGYYISYSYNQSDLVSQETHYNWDFKINDWTPYSEAQYYYSEFNINNLDYILQEYSSNPSPMYNLLGVPVQKGHKGIVIQNGKKTLLK